MPPLAARPGHTGTVNTSGRFKGEASATGSGDRQLAATDAEQVVSEVAGRLRARGERMTGPRRAVLTVLAEEAPGHASAEEIAARVATSTPRVHRASVYRTLEALCDLGVVQHVHAGHAATAYHLVTGRGRHLHGHCRGCGTMIDFPEDLLDAVAGRLAREHGFALDPDHVALSGRCAACQSRPADD